MGMPRIRKPAQVERDRDHDALMLEHLGEEDAAAAIVRAIEAVLTELGLRTADLGGKATTEICGRAIADAIG